MTHEEKGCDRSEQTKSKDKTENRRIVQSLVRLETYIEAVFGSFHLGLLSHFFLILTNCECEKAVAWCNYW
jgi:hypothetical protein